MPPDNGTARGSTYPLTAVWVGTVAPSGWPVDATRLVDADTSRITTPCATPSRINGPRVEMRDKSKFLASSFTEPVAWLTLKKSPIFWLPRWSDEVKKTLAGAVRTISKVESGTPPYSGSALYVHPRASSPTYSNTWLPVEMYEVWKNSTSWATSM